jgi:hypothetical protein
MDATIVKSVNVHGTQKDPQRSAALCAGQKHRSSSPKSSGKGNPSMRTYRPRPPAPAAIGVRVLRGEPSAGSVVKGEAVSRSRTSARWRRLVHALCRASISPQALRAISDDVTVETDHGRQQTPRRPARQPGDSLAQSILRHNVGATKLALRLCWLAPHGWRRDADAPVRHDPGFVAPTHRLGKRSRVPSIHRPISCATCRRPASVAIRRRYGPKRSYRSAGAIFDAKSSIPLATSLKGCPPISI